MQWQARRIWMTGYPMRAAAPIVATMNRRALKLELWHIVCAVIIGAGLIAWMVLGAYV
jgi:hypothetical protein